MTPNCFCFRHAEDSKLNTTRSASVAETYTNIYIQISYICQDTPHLCHIQERNGSHCFLLWHNHLFWTCGTCSSDLWGAVKCRIDKTYKWFMVLVLSLSPLAKPPETRICTIKSRWHGGDQSTNKPARWWPVLPSKIKPINYQNIKYSIFTFLKLRSLHIILVFYKKKK